MAKNISSTSKNTNLFYQLYSTSNDITTSGFQCSSAVDEMDTNFKISDTLGEITDSNGESLASIDLSGINAPEITEYMTETKVLGPQSAYLLQGNVSGDTYAAQFFPFHYDIQCKEFYGDFINVSFDIHYVNCNTLKCTRIDTRKTRTEPGDVCELINDALANAGISVAVCVRELETCTRESTTCSTCTGQASEPVYTKPCSELIDYLSFQSTEEGYQFFVHNVIVYPVCPDYTNADDSYADYTSSPFAGADINYEYVMNLIRLMRPRTVGTDYRSEYDKVPCDIYKFLISIAPVAKDDTDAFAYNIEALKLFAKLFDEQGVFIEENYNKFVHLSHTYNQIYAYYFGNEYGICNFYNIHDIITMLESVASYVRNANIGSMYMLVEDTTKRIYSQKYPNGALRGILLVPEWPAGANTFASMKINHVAEHVYLDEELQLPDGFKVEGDGYCPTTKVYTKVKANVKINTLLAEELEVYKQSECFEPLRKITSNEATCSCLEGLWTYDTEMYDQDGDNMWSNSTTQIENNTVWSDVIVPSSENEKEMMPNSKEHLSEYEIYNKVPMYTPKKQKEYKENTIGLYRYMQYLNENDLWTRLGEMYAVVGKPDDYQSTIKNLQNSILIYNPNQYPVKIKILLFS